MERQPEEIREEIDGVREGLGDTLEELGDRVAPQKVVARAKAEAAQKVETVKEKVSPRRLAGRGADGVRRGVRRVVGSDSGPGGRPPALEGSARGQGRAVTQRARGAASTVAESVGDAPQAVRQRAEGNPVAAGLLAFAGGFFAAALLPPSERECQLTQKAKEGLQPLAQGASEVGKTVAGELQATAQAGMEAVKETATEAAGEVKGRAQSSAERVKEQASGATETVGGRARSATKTVQRQAKGATGAVKGQARTATGQARRPQVLAPSAR